MTAAAILGFWNYNFLTVGRIMRVKLRNHAKFCNDWSNRCRDIAIFALFKMVAATISDFKHFKFLTSKRSGRLNRNTVPNFIKITQTAAEIWQFFKMAAAAIMDFWNYKFLAVGHVKSVKLHHCAKFQTVADI